MPDRRLPGCVDLGHHAQAGSLPAADRAGRAGRGGRYRAQLEVAVHLSAVRRGVAQRADHPDRHADQFPPDVGIDDERVLRAAARQHGLHHGRYADASASDCRSPRHLPRPVGCLQRCGLLRHALQDPRHLARGVRCVGQPGEGVRQGARPQRLSHARATQQQRPGHAVWRCRPPGCSTVSSTNTCWPTARSAAQMAPKHCWPPGPPCRHPSPARSNKSC